MWIFFPSDDYVDHLIMHHATLPPALPLPRLPVSPQSVSDNPIKEWALDVSNLRKMKHLRLKRVGLDKFPEGIGRLNKLETLDLSDNRIDVLEQSTASLFKLTMLDLSGNDIPVRGTPPLRISFFLFAMAKQERIVWSACCIWPHAVCVPAHVVGEVKSISRINFR